MYKNTRTSFICIYCEIEKYIKLRFFARRDTYIRRRAINNLCINNILGWNCIKAHLALSIISFINFAFLSPVLCTQDILRAYTRELGKARRWSSGGGGGDVSKEGTQGRLRTRNSWIRDCTRGAPGKRLLQLPATAGRLDPARRDWKKRRYIQRNRPMSESFFLSFSFLSPHSLPHREKETWSTVINASKQIAFACAFQWYHTNCYAIYSLSLSLNKVFLTVYSI